MTTQTTPAEFIEPLAEAFPPASDADERWLASMLFRLLAKGEPVETARLAGAVGRPEADIAEALDAAPFGRLTYRDDRGRVVGFGGLAVGDLAASPHRLKLDGRELYAWCAGDALFLPVVLDREVPIESQCPTSGERISLVVSPEGFRDLEPSGAVMSFLAPDELAARAEAGGDVIRNFCHFVHFFASKEAAQTWIEGHPGTTQISIADGFEIGRRWVGHVWGLGADR
jgi:alkylmercury lyase